MSKILYQQALNIENELKALAEDIGAFGKKIESANTPAVEAKKNDLNIAQIFASKKTPAQKASAASEEIKKLKSNLQAVNNNILAATNNKNDEVLLKRLDALKSNINNYSDQVKTNNTISEFEKYKGIAESFEKRRQFISTSYNKILDNLELMEKTVAELDKSISIIEPQISQYRLEQFENLAISDKGKLLTGAKHKQPSVLTGDDRLVTTGDDRVMRPITQ